MEGSQFTIKEIVIDTNKKIDKFIDRFDDHLQESDARFDVLEKKDAARDGSIKTILWILGFLGAGGLGAILKVFVL